MAKFGPVLAKGPLRVARDIVKEAGLLLPVRITPDAAGRWRPPPTGPRSNVTNPIVGPPARGPTGKKGV